VNLTLARNYIIQSARNAGDTTEYPAFRQDMGIKVLLDDFIRVTGCTRKEGVVSFTANNDTGGSLPADFAPERIMRAYIDADRDLTITDHSALLFKQKRSTTAGTPCEIAFTNAATIKAWPTPAANTDVQLEYWTTLVAWTEGTTSPDGVTINVPDDVLRTALWYGGAASIQGNQKEQGARADVAWKKYLAFRDEVRGTYQRGAKLVAREDFLDE